MTQDKSELRRRFVADLAPRIKPAVRAYGYDQRSAEEVAGELFDYVDALIDLKLDDRKDARNSRATREEQDDGYLF